MTLRLLRCHKVQAFSAVALCHFHLKENKRHKEEKEPNNCITLLEK